MGDTLQNSPLDRLRALEWSTDSVSLGDLVFEIGLTRERPASDGTNLALYKSQGFLHNYEALLTARPDFRPKRILELGIWQGGSIALWNEIFQPERLSAIDILRAPTIRALAGYVESATPNTIALHWHTSQDDTQALASVIATDFDGEPPDLVIDDASHLYGPTRRSFEWLFPRMASGGVYVIEDWRSNVESPSPDALHRIATDLVYTKALGRTALRSITVLGGIIVVERGKRDQELPFTLATERAVDHPTTSVKSRLRQLVTR